MTSTIGRYAQIPIDSNIVENTIVMPENFTLSGYRFVEIKIGCACEPGAFYNESDGLFYADSDFSIITGTETNTLNQNSES